MLSTSLFAVIQSHFYHSRRNWLRKIFQLFYFELRMISFNVSCVIPGRVELNLGNDFRGAGLNRNELHEVKLNGVELNES